MSLVGNLHQPLNAPCFFSVQHMGLGVQLASTGAAVLKSFFSGTVHQEQFFFQELYTRSIFFRSGAEEPDPKSGVLVCSVPPPLSPSWGVPSLRMSLSLVCPFPLECPFPIVCPFPLECPFSLVCPFP